MGELFCCPPPFFIIPRFTPALLSTSWITGEERYRGNGYGKTKFFFSRGSLEPATTHASYNIITYAIPIRNGFVSRLLL